MSAHSLPPAGLKIWFLLGIWNLFSEGLKDSEGHRFHNNMGLFEGLPSVGGEGESIPGPQIYFAECQSDLLGQCLHAV